MRRIPLIRKAGEAENERNYRSGVPEESIMAGSLDLIRLVGDVYASAEKAGGWNTLAESLSVCLRHIPFLH